MVSSSTKRRAVKYAGEEGLGSSAVACRAPSFPRSTYHRVSETGEESLEVQKEILRLSEKNPRYGYRRITAMMRREGYQIDEKRVLRVRREAGFKVRQKQPRARRVGLSTARRRKAEKRGDVWSRDAMTDQTAHGSQFRILNLIDEHTRECLARCAGRSIRAIDVITVIEAAIERFGAPNHIRSDNDPEWERSESIHCLRCAGLAQRLGN
ncbi:MAG: IS3 family transposase [Verrucomicrobiales bacterium]|nr:IS3 family transposase [Verrucomicrobiales bacterium]